MAREVAPNIFEIDTRVLGHEKLIASYLIRGSDKTVLIDPGFASSSQTVLNEISDIGVDPENLDYILLTHSHIDHAGGVGILAKTVKAAKVIAHQRGAFYLKNSIKIGGGAKMIFGDLADDLGEPIDTPADRIRTVSEGDQIDLGDMKLDVYYTPGHSGDHISLFEAKTASLFTGDTGCLNYPELGNVLIPAGSPPIYQSGYILEELERFSGLGARRVLTPHFGEAANDPGAFISDNMESVRSSRKTIDGLFRQGNDFQQVVERLRSNIIEASGMGPSEIPEFLSDVWLRIMLKTGLMGFMADILEYARDLRPFTEERSEVGP